jgi:cell division protein DivIC
MRKRRKSKPLLKSDFFKKIKERTLQRKKKITRVLFLLLFVFVGYRFFAGPYGFIQIHSLWQEKKNLEKESKMLQAQMVDLEIEKKRLENDKFYIEKQARERLGMVKEGEKVYKFVPLKEAPPDTSEKMPSSGEVPPESDSLPTQIGERPPR